MNNTTGAHERFRHWAATLLKQRQAATGHDDEVYQFSTISALLEGVYDGDVTVADILRHGDFGLGTFNHLDGEMVILDGVCYRLRADGTASRAAPTDRTPFAAVTRFHSDFEIAIETRTGRAEVTAAIDRQIQSPNLIYAIRITGQLRRTAHPHGDGAETALSPVDASDRRAGRNRIHRYVRHGGRFPHPRLRTGHLRGRISPALPQHDRTGGGHVLDFSLERGTVAVSGASQMHLSLPTSGAFLGAQLSGDDLAERIGKAEGRIPSSDGAIGESCRLRRQIACPIEEANVTCANVRFRRRRIHGLFRHASVPHR